MAREQSTSTTPPASQVISQIGAQIYLSGLRPLIERPEAVQTLGVTHILSLLDGPQVREVHRRLLWLDPALQVMAIPYRDRADQNLRSRTPWTLGAAGLSDEQARALADRVTGEDNLETGRLWIQEAVEQGGVILVHCAAGHSRSASVLAYYLMGEYGMSWQQALRMIAAGRPSISPNPGFCEQLRQADPLSSLHI